jgi:hypothetical protein
MAQVVLLLVFMPGPQGVMILCSKTRGGEGEVIIFLLHAEV